MKKVLLTSTAIVAFAGAAAADVSLSGSAELGLFDDGSDGENLGFFSSVDVRFSMTGETDGGLSFGATIDLDDALETGATNQIGDLNDFDNADYTIFLSGGFGTLTFGDTDGAMDWALTEGGNIGNPGSIADDETAYSGYAGSYLDGYDTNGGTAGGSDSMILRYQYSFGDYSFAVSVEQGSDYTELEPDGEVGYAIGFRGSLAGLSFGIGYQEAADGSDTDLAGISAVYTINDFSIGAMYADGGNDTDDLELLQVGAGYSINNVSLHLNYAEITEGTTESEGFGFAAAYELGDGISAHFAYGSGEEGDADSVDTYSIGLAMSF